MVTADQIVAHLVGDYILQSDWMAQRKTSATWPAIIHAICYSLPFLFFRPSLLAVAFITATHFVIDRWRLARYVVWAKNFLMPPCLGHLIDDACLHWNMPSFRHCSATGYPPDRPAWLAVWLMIIADNTMHLLLNGIALKYL